MNGVHAPKPAPGASSRIPTIAACAAASLTVFLGDLLSFAFEAPHIDFGSNSPTAYLVAMFAIPVILCGAHGIVALGLLRLVERVRPSAVIPLAIAAAAAIGGLWQETLMRGDGIRSLEYFEMLQLAGWLLVPMATAGFVATLAVDHRTRPVVRRTLAAVVAVALLVAPHILYPLNYRDFHAYNSLLAVALFTWAATPSLRGRRSTVTCWALLAAGLLLPFTVGNWEIAQRYVQRHADGAGALLKLPTAQWAAYEPESLLRPDRNFTAEEVEEFRAELARGDYGDRRGKNVIVVVLESTRADAWNDPTVAPKFHEWRKNGLYFPRAVAQYPATPLAYGAMFTSHPPSVLVQTSAWARTRLFGSIADEFDHFVLSRPDNHWFEQSVITDFFLPAEAEVSTHRHAYYGMKNLRTGIQARDANEPFFAWVHLYEPHQPWTRRERFTSGEDRLSRYLSEVSVLDDELGNFMKWFYEQPFAEETLVVVIADHGEGVEDVVDGRPFRGHHVHVRNFLSHIPAYFSGPGIPEGAVATGYTFQQLDVMPTIFDFLGVPLPPEALAQGTSLYRLMAEEPTRPLVTEAFSIRGKQFFQFVGRARAGKTTDAREEFRDVTTSGRYSPKIGLQMGDTKIIREMLLTRTWVYDVAADPRETNDLAARDPERTARMEEELRHWKKRQSWVVQELESQR